MADGGVIIMIGAAIAVSLVIGSIYWVDRVEPREIYEPDPAPETTEQRFRKAHGEEGQ
jgi:hypothetical protein